MSSAGPESPGTEILAASSPKKSAWARIREDARTQMVLLSLCNFCSIGMWNSLNGLGDLGTGDANLAQYCNTAGYFTGIVSGVIAAALINVIGVKLCALLGLAAMTVDIFSYYAYYYHHWIPLWFVILENAIGGIGVSCLSAAVGMGLVHYPTEGQRNMYIAISSMILNIGGLSGALVGFVMNASKDENSASVALSPNSYLVIVMIAGSGLLVGSFLCSPDRVKKLDGTTPHIPLVNVRHEVHELKIGIREKKLWMMVPFFLCSVWHEVVLFNFFNSKLFNVRSRAFNSGCYYVARIFASFIFQFAADYFQHLRFRVWSALTTIIVFLIISVLPAAIVFAGGFDLMYMTDLDFTDSRSAILIISFFGYGALETMVASMTYWLIGVLPLGDAHLKNRYVGWSKSFTNIGGGVSWLSDLHHAVPYGAQWGVNITLWCLGLTGIFFVCEQTLRETARGKEEEADKLENGGMLMKCSREIISHDKSSIVWSASLPSTEESIQAT